MSTQTRTIEIFTAGCPLCSDVVDRVETLACDSCEIVLRRMGESEADERADELGIARVPSVAVDGETLACCESDGVDEEKLREAGVGSPVT